MDIGPAELIIVLLVVLLLFGGSKLPKLAKSLGEAQRELKKGMSGEDTPVPAPPPVAPVATAPAAAAPTAAPTPVAEVPTPTPAGEPATPAPVEGAAPNQASA